MKLNIAKDKRMIITVPAYMHKKIKLDSVKTSKSMNLLVNEALLEKYK